MPNYSETILLPQAAPKLPAPCPQDSSRISPKEVARWGYENRISAHLSQNAVLMRFCAQAGHGTVT